MNEPVLLRLAHETISAAVREVSLPALPSSKNPPRPVFVTIERQGRVLGCRGTLETRGTSLEDAVREAAVSAARHDPRYRPLSVKDLADFLVTITVLERLDPLANIETLAPSDGLVLRSGTRTGIVLPWEGRDSRTRLRWAFAKAGVATNTAHTLQRMTAVRFRG